jgi:hypothetical protein
MPPIKPEWLFDLAGAKAGGTVEWGQPVPEHGPGVYIVTVTEPLIDGQSVVYIGRAKCLSRRLGQFYRHQLGRSSPHSGGQRILTLNSPKLIHWAPVERYADAEHAMLQGFRDAVGTWPLGNRVKSARMAPISK